MPENLSSFTHEGAARRAGAGLIWKLELNLLHPRNLGLAARA